MTIQEAKIFIDQNLALDSHVEMGYAAMILEDLFEIRNLNRVGVLTDDQVERLRTAVQEINAGAPLQYAVGLAHFYGRRFLVNKDVLIPRPETEELVFNALEAQVPNREMPIDVLDIGTGSGCIAITLKKEAPAWRLSALDVSLPALEVAAENAKNLHAEVAFYLDDITDIQEPIITDGAWDLIVSNPPYISESELNQMDQHVISHEPHLALFPQNGSPQEMYESILRYARLTLKKGGIICMELNEYLAAEIESIAKELGFNKVRLVKDLQGKSRMLFAEKDC